MSCLYSDRSVWRILCLQVEAAGAVVLQGWLLLRQFSLLTDQHTHQTHSLACKFSGLTCWSWIYCFIIMTRRFKELCIDIKTNRVFQLMAEWRVVVQLVCLCKETEVWKFLGKLLQWATAREIPDLIQGMLKTAKMLSASLPWSLKNYKTKNKINQSDLNHTGNGSSRFGNSALCLWRIIINLSTNFLS